MRATSVFVIMTALALVGCHSAGEVTLEVDARWQLRCSEEDSGCLTPRTPRAVDGRDGDPGVTVSCNLVKLDDTRRFLNILLKDGSGNSLELQNVIIDESGEVQATDGCAVRVQDDGVIFSSLHCGPELPSEDQPCQISLVSIDEAAQEGPILSTTVLCRDIHDLGFAETRDLVSPDSPSPAVMPAPITIIYCEGI